MKSGLELPQSKARRKFKLRIVLFFTFIAFIVTMALPHSILLLISVTNIFEFKIPTVYALKLQPIQLFLVHRFESELSYFFSTITTIHRKEIGPMCSRNRSLPHLLKQTLRAILT